MKIVSQIQSIIPLVLIGSKIHGLYRSIKALPIIDKNTDKLNPATLLVYAIIGFGFIFITIAVIAFMTGNYELKY